jgi:hypothetical protein
MRTITIWAKWWANKQINNKMLLNNCNISKIVSKHICFCVHGLLLLTNCKTRVQKFPYGGKIYKLQINTKPSFLIHLDISVINNVQMPLKVTYTTRGQYNIPHKNNQRSN